MRRTLAEVKAYYKEQRRLARIASGIATVENEMRTHAVPHKCHRGPITARSRVSYGANVLMVTPGAVRDETRSGAYLSALKMIAADTTGTRLATESEEARLLRSPTNSNTTQGNYNRTVRHT